ncbi:hypothetical protein JST97_02985 [bacterium]|nr:hypothetical protein [bacterium]
MQTPTIAFSSNRQQISFYDREGRNRSLEVCQDGRLESAFSADLQDGFVSDLNDPRLSGQELGAAQLGKGWTYSYSGGEKLRFESGRQEISSEQRVDGSRLVSVTTRSDQGEHQMSAVIQNGSVQAESLRESARLDVSAAGLNVLRDGKVLFEMPSAFGGGCTW